MILSGMSTMDQIRDNVATGYQLKLAVPCTACRYSRDGCPVKIGIPAWLNLYNELSLTKDKKRWEEAVKAQNGPDTCIGCGQCTSHCPQNIDVPGYMKKLAAGKY